LIRFDKIFNESPLIKSILDFGKLSRKYLMAGKEYLSMISILVIKIFGFERSIIRIECPIYTPISKTSDLSLTTS
jgi:hypothetical protein